MLFLWWREWANQGELSSKNYQLTKIADASHCTGIQNFRAVFGWRASISQINEIHDEIRVSQKGDMLKEETKT